MELTEKRGEDWSADGVRNKRVASVELVGVFHEIFDNADHDLLEERHAYPQVYAVSASPSRCSILGVLPSTRIRGGRGNITMV